VGWWVISGLKQLRKPRDMEAGGTCGATHSCLEIEPNTMGIVCCGGAISIMSNEMFCSV
jgi:hypothetical protein